MSGSGGKAGFKSGLRGILGWRDYSTSYYLGDYMTLCIYQSPKHVIAQRLRFNACTLQKVHLEVRKVPGRQADYDKGMTTSPKLLGKGAELSNFGNVWSLKIKSRKELHTSTIL